ncbi:ead/Ea22-like family protein [Enterobacter hormaechei]|uniref:ead/Ea22-like family protein n=1 Tax=Enterobacter hormaechei TaxID=158836 RepID=UPI0018EA53E0|nr:ead/Ea22-like family protein [Enterobacter hormaechei]MBJ6408948.1 ead/Ea22-like family protein [Enterobacter hormaechei]
MSNIDKRALREAAVRAGGVKWQYMRATQHSKAYITDDKGSTVINCTDGDVPAKCAGFLESANPAAVLALLDELEAAENRMAELEAREVNGRFLLPKDSSQGWKIDPEFISKIQDAIGYDEECQCWEGSPSMEMVEAVLIAAAAIKMDERG